MPAFDANVSATVTAASGTSNSSTGQALGRVGLPYDLTATCVITDATTTAVGASSFQVDVSVDGGSVWKAVGIVGITQAEAQTLGLIKSFAVGFADIIPEGKTQANIQWRLTVKTTNALAEQIVVTCYLGFPAGFVGPN